VTGEGFGSLDGDWGDLMGGEPEVEPIGGVDFGIQPLGEDFQIAGWIRAIEEGEGCHWAIGFGLFVFGADAMGAFDEELALPERVLDGRAELGESPGDFFVGEGDARGMGDWGWHVCHWVYLNVVKGGNLFPCVVVYPDRRSLFWNIEERASYFDWLSAGTSTGSVQANEADVVIGLEGAKGSKRLRVPGVGVGEFLVDVVGRGLGR
jgi:hypothetical protein